MNKNKVKTGKNNKKNFIVGISVLVVIVLVAILIATNTKTKNKNKDNNPKDYVEIGVRNVDYDNMENAKLDKNGNKICVSKDLEKKHYVMSAMTQKKTSLTANNVKISSNKEDDTLHAEVPITNEGKKTLEYLNIDVSFIGNKNIALYRDTFVIEKLEPKETYVIKIDYARFDITNTKTYEVWLLD